MKSALYFELLLLLFATLIRSGYFYNIKYVNSKELPGLEYLDRNVDPCENFFKFTCGNFAHVHPKPEKEPTWDHFTILQTEIHNLMKEILSAKKDPEQDPVAVQKAKTAYRACTNLNYADQLSQHELPQLSVLRKLNGWPLMSLGDSDEELSWENVGNLVAEYGIPMIFNIYADSSLFNASEVTLWINRDALSNPSTIYGGFDEPLDDYLDKPSLKPKRETVPIPFEVFVRKIAYRLRDLEGTWKSDEAINDDIAELLDFMRVLQKGGFTDNANFTSLNSVASVKTLQEWTDTYFPNLKLNWLSYLNSIFGLSGVEAKPDMNVIIWNTAIVYGVLNLISQTEPRVIKNLLLTRLFTYMAPDSDQYMREAFDEYYTKQKYTVYPRDQYCLRKILGYPGFVDLSFALTHVYQRYYFNINKLQKAGEMVQDLQDAFDDIISDSDWIDDGTKAKALKKAEKMITLLGFPDFVTDPDSVDTYYENLRICEWDHFGNAQRLRAMRQAVVLAKMGKPRNREIWNLSPLEVNAFYNRQNNRIMFPISIINPLFFNGEISVLDYGRIGAIIGHEITHGFDKGGMTYDENGTIGQEWNPDTLQEFNRRAQCFDDQYRKYYIEEIDKYVNGTQTLDENLADNGGLKEAFKAFKKLITRGDQLVSVKEYTLEQLFFIAYGTMWCMTETDDYLQTMNAKDAHSPGRFRVIGAVSNMPEFAEAFNCPLGSKMNPVEKCSLW